MEWALLAVGVFALGPFVLGYAAGQWGLVLAWVGVWTFVGVMMVLSGQGEFPDGAVALAVAVFVAVTGLCIALGVALRQRTGKPPFSDRPAPPAADGDSDGTSPQR